jgi:LEA14-like dessication related protein
MSPSGGMVQGANRKSAKTPVRSVAVPPLAPDRVSGLQAVFLLLLSLTVAACATTAIYQDPPRVTLTSIQPKDMTLLEQRYSLQLRVMNPNDVAIPVQGLSYALEINGREFAYGVSNVTLSIPPFGEALLDVEVVSNLLNIMQQVQEMQGEQHDSLSYRLSGKINLDNSPARLPFEYEGELKYLPATTETPAP